MVLAAALTLTDIVALPAPSYAGPFDLRPVRVVVLVDESGSLTPADVTAEQNAAALIAQSEFATDSEIAVLGFGSVNGPGQVPVDVVCELTKVDAGTNREYLSKCVRGLHRRAMNEGDDTDFAKALAQALSIMNSPSDVPRQKIIFLLTDGVLDVRNSPSWGANPNERNAAAGRDLDRSLAAASTAGIQVWPLGFGSQLDKPELDRFAAAGSQKTCGPGAPAPSARVARDNIELARHLFEAFGAARCSAVSPFETRPLPSGQKVDIPVEISPITTDGAIAVMKGDPRISVQYFAPGNDSTPVPKTGLADGSEFSVSGESSAVEVLRIVNPKPGRWLVRLTSGPEVPAQNVVATVFWQGRVQSSITVNPPAPEIGKPVLVYVSVHTRNNMITDPGGLSFLRVSVRLTGDGFDPVPVALADDGTGPDTTAGEGLYTGTATIPTTATGGPLRFTSVVGGQGIDADEVTLDTVPVTGSHPITAQLRFTMPDRVAPGGTVTGVLALGSSSGRDTRVRMVLTGLSEGAAVTVAPAVIEVPGSGRIEVPLTLQFGAGSPVGRTNLTVNVTDDVSGVVYHTQPYSINVAPPPPWPVRYAWLIALVLILLVLALCAVGYWQFRQWQARPVRRLVLLLYRDGEVIHQLRTPDGWALSFRFVICDELTAYPYLEGARDTDRAYVLSRTRDGSEVTVDSPLDGEIKLAPGQPRSMSGGLALSYRDLNRTLADYDDPSRNDVGRSGDPLDDPEFRPLRPSDTEDQLL